MQYSVGKVLPTSIKVAVLDPISEETSVEEILVSYPNKPLICSACCFIGHLIGACPRVSRKWVRKVVVPSSDQDMDARVQDELGDKSSKDEITTNPLMTEAPSAQGPNTQSPTPNNMVDVDEEPTNGVWKIAGKKEMLLPCLFQKGLLAL